MAYIGIDARLTHYRVGGTSRYIRALVGAFEELEPAHEFTLLQSRKSKRRLSSRYASASIWTPPHHRWERAALSLELWRHRLDLLHSPDFIAPYRAARRHIITVHDLSFIHYPEYLTADSRRYYNGQIHASLKRADHILSVSQATKKDLIEILDVPAELISVQLHGVDESFKPLPRQATAPVIRQLEFAGRICVICGNAGTAEKSGWSGARLSRSQERIPGCAEAWQSLGVLAGTYEQLMAELQAAGIDEYAEIRQQVTDAQLPALYNHALALVTPSFYEGFGLPALEAMACGTVPIVSGVSSLPEIVGDVGLLIDPHERGDALRRR